MEDKDVVHSKSEIQWLLYSDQESNTDKKLQKLVIL